MRKSDCVFERLLFEGLALLGATQQATSCSCKKNSPADNNLQLCDNAEGTVQSEVQPSNINKAFFTKHRIHGIHRLLL